MKQPRTSDFDPKAKKHDLKSSLDNFPAIEKPPVVAPEAVMPKQSAPVQENQGTLVLPSSTPDNKRKFKKRHPFDIYEDQVDALKKLSIEEQVQGGIGSMSAMVRDALDAYLSNKHPDKS